VASALLCVVIGVICTLGVAVTMHLNSWNIKSEWSSYDASIVHWWSWAMDVHQHDIMTFDKPPEAPLDVRAERRKLQHLRYVPRDQAPFGGQPGYSAKPHNSVWSCYETGFPFRCLMGAAFKTEGSPVIYQGCWPCPALWNTSGPWPWPIPLMPIWRGLLADSALYASAGWLTLSAISTWRSTLRRRSGLCAHCRYDLRGTPPGSPCPECGARSSVELSSGTSM
jgi:hypothetical protein